MKHIQRSFIPGSDWLYIKIYAGDKTMDKILSKEIAAIISKLKKGDLIDKWFFIRYADPDSHIRIRFLVKESSHIGTLINIVYNQLKRPVTHNLIWKIQIDTYNRELERYGYDLIEEVESFFQKDSECILSIIKKIDTYQNENYRWMIALKLIDSILSDFDFDIPSKLAFTEKQNNSFKKEFGFDEYNAKQFNGKFRGHKLLVESILNDDISDDHFLQLCNCIQKRTKDNKLIINQLYLKIKKHETNRIINSLLSSFIHMTLIRLFMGKNRTHELVLYDFLKRYYTSQSVLIKL